MKLNHKVFLTSAVGLTMLWILCYLILNPFLTDYEGVFFFYKALVINAIPTAVGLFIILIYPVLQERKRLKEFNKHVDVKK